MFNNRRAAGRLLAERLAALRSELPLVLALPRGGVPIAAEIAKHLGTDYDLLLIKRITSPLAPEVAIGAVSEDGSVLWQSESLRYLSLKNSDAERLARVKKIEVDEQAAQWRNSRKFQPLKNRCVILVDDGLATGSSMSLAVEIARKRGAKKVIVAVPVAPLSAVKEIRLKADDVIVLMVPERFQSVSQWYEDFSEVSDADVTEIFSTRQIARDQEEEEVFIPLGSSLLQGVLSHVNDPKALVVFAHGSGSTHLSVRSRSVAQALNRAGFSTLLIDLLTEDEALIPRNTFDIPLISKRLSLAVSFVRERLGDRCPPIALFGASTGASAAIVSAAQDPTIIAVVSRGGRVDLAGQSLEIIRAPVLLIVGSEDQPILTINALVKKQIKNCDTVQIVGAGHLFEKPGELEQVSQQAIEWIKKSIVS